MRENGKLLVDEPRYRSGNVFKSTKKQCLRFLADNALLNSSILCTFRLVRSSKLEAAIFKTGERPILWQEQFKDLREYRFLNTVSHFHQISCTSFSCCLVKILTKYSPARKEFLSQNKHSKCDSLFLRNHVILHNFVTQLPNLDKV